MNSSIIKGHIRYTSKKPERMDQDRGREDFTFVRHGDGTRILSAHCEIDEPNPSVARDVVVSVDADGLLLDAFVRVMVGGNFSGAGFFRMVGDTIECDSYGPDIGRVTQRVDTQGLMDAFNTHPLSVDGYHLGRFDRSEGPVTRRVQNFLPSLDHRGASAPMISGHHILLEYVGDEIITVAAGTFDTWHFRFVGEADDPIAHPPYDLWMTADDDCIFVLGQVAGTMQTHYELISLER